MLPPPTYDRALHRTAVLTAVFSMLPISVGALVTSTRAGMAFLDWPTSDGHNMFLYPWLMSAGDKFVEHGHRLAGILIGIAAIALVAVLWKRETRAWVTWVGVAGLLGVIAQGLLGGLRVIENNHTIAMLHGTFASLVFCNFGAVALFTSRRWIEAAQSKCDQKVNHLKPLALIVPLVVLVQYLLGGMIRHLGIGLHEHLGMAFVVLGLAIYAYVQTRRSSTPWIITSGNWLVLAVIMQFALGLSTWVMKFGFATIGYVAIADSWQQVFIRTTHTVFGMLVMLAAVLHTLRVFRIAGSNGVTWRTQSEMAPTLQGGAG